MADPQREQGRPLEVRFAGRTLSTLVPYGEQARDRSERFDTRALAPDRLVVANVQHDPAFEFASTSDGTVRLEQRADGMAVEIDLTGAPLDLVRRKALTGISPEFYATAEHREGNVRVITGARLVGFGLVDVSSYRTPLELRAEADGTARMDRLRRWALLG